MHIRITFILFFIFSNSHAQEFANQIQLLNKNIQELHVSPKIIDNDFSLTTSSIFIDLLDTDKNIFSQENINYLKKHELVIDDYFNSKETAFIQDYINEYKKAIVQIKNIINSTPEAIFDTEKIITFRGNKPDVFFKDKAELAHYWQTKVLFKCFSKSLIQNNGNIDTTAVYIKEHKKELLQKHKELLLCELDEKFNFGINKFVEKCFLNAFAKSFDPHTNYFDYQTKQLFENSLSKTVASFGFNFNKKDGELYISEVLFGSQAWKKNLLFEDEKIVSLQIKNKDIDLSCISVIEMTMLLNDDNLQKIAINVRAESSEVRSLTLVKEELTVSENYVQGFITNHKGNTFGYIKIPSFYTSFETKNSLGLANDFAKELVKLNQQNISGLVIDLRNNGGGSIKEASDIAGMFIDKGPLGIFKAQKKEVVIKDFNRGSSFNKPLIVLTNNYSASASEYFSGIIQDYNLGIIMGSRTFGKGSGQIITPLDEKNEQLGYTKVTIELIYKVSGISYQGDGIIPDIIYPNLFDDNSVTEKNYPNALKGTLLEPLIHKEERVLFNKHLGVTSETTAYFETVSNINVELFKTYNTKKSYKLSLDNLSKDYEAYNKLIKDINKLSEKSTDVIFENTLATDEELLFDTERKEINQILLKQLQSDKLLAEAIKTLTLNTN